MGQIAPRRRRRWPFILVVLLAVVAAALVAADFAARTAAQDAIASHVQRSTHAQRVRVSISAFPFLWDVAAEGRIPGVDVVGYGVPAGPVTVDQVSLDARGVSFDRHQLLSSQSARLTSVSRATVTVVIHLTSAEYSLVHDLGVQVDAASSRRVTLSVAGRTVVTFNLTRIPIVPDCPLAVSASGANYTFTCTVSPVPPAVLTALSQLHRS